MSRLPADQAQDVPVGIPEPGDLIDYLTLSAAGRVAERRLVPEDEAHTHAQYDVADEIAAIELLSVNAAQRMPRMLAEARASVLVTQHAHVIGWVALRLMIEGRLDGDNVRAMIEEHRQASGSLMKDIRG